MRFQTKKDRMYAFSVWGQIVLLGVIFWLNSTNLAGLLVWIAAIFIFYVAYILWIWFRTFYVIDEDRLVVRSGPYQQSILIEDIEKLKVLTDEKVRAVSPVIGPALSSERVNIIYGADHDLLSLSPQQKDTFIQELRRRNRKIKLTTVDEKA